MKPISARVAELWPIGKLKSIPTTQDNIQSSRSHNSREASRNLDSPTRFSSTKTEPYSPDMASSWPHACLD